MYIRCFLVLILSKFKILINKSCKLVKIEQIINQHKKIQIHGISHPQKEVNIPNIEIEYIYIYISVAEGSTFTNLYHSTKKLFHIIIS